MFEYDYEHDYTTFSSCFLLHAVRATRYNGVKGAVDRMTPTDQSRKMRIVLIAAVMGLVGFVLEVGPLGAFTHVKEGFAYELPALGFLAYLALAASAAVGLHLTETEPTLKDEEQEEPTELTPSAQGEAAGERVRVRPELHQLRMLLTALGGYLVLKGISNLFISMMYPGAVLLPQLQKGFEFGFFYVALGWFVLWQFLRWYAATKQWVRLQDELAGGDVSRVVAVVIFMKMLLSFYTLVITPHAFNIYLILTILLYLTLLPAAFLLWTARPYTLRQTITGLLTTGAVIVLFTIALTVLDYTMYHI